MGTHLCCWTVKGQSVLLLWFKEALEEKKNLQHLFSRLWHTAHFQAACNVSAMLSVKPCDVLNDGVTVQLKAREVYATQLVRNMPVNLAIAFTTEMGGLLLFLARKTVLT